MYLLSETVLQTLWGSGFFCGAILVAAAALFLVNSRTWRQRQEESPDDRTRQFFRRQYVRRQRMNGLIVVAGVGAFAANWVRTPALLLASWLMLTMLVFWIVLLAALDMLTTRAFLMDVEAQQKTTRRVLEAEVDRLRKLAEQHVNDAAHGGNGNGQNV